MVFGSTPSSATPAPALFTNTAASSLSPSATAPVTKKANRTCCTSGREMVTGDGCQGGWVSGCQEFLPSFPLAFDPRTTASDSKLKNPSQGERPSISCPDV